VLVDYRYHIGSFVAIFLALLLGILVGIGLAPHDPQELNKVVTDLKQQYRETQRYREADLKALAADKDRYEALAKEAIAALTTNRLVGRRVAIILDHDFGDSPLPGHLRALMKQAGATLTSTTTIAANFVTLPEPVRRRAAQRLSLYPPPGVHFRSLIAEALAKDLADGHGELARELQALGLLKSSADSTYRMPVDSVLLVGGAASEGQAALERIDLPLLSRLLALGVRVVGCEASDAAHSAIPLYKSKGIPTVDNADTLAGRLAIVWAFAGANGHFGVKETADRFLPVMSASGRP